MTDSLTDGLKGDSTCHTTSAAARAKWENTFPCKHKHITPGGVCIVCGARVVRIEGENIIRPEWE